MSLGVKALQEFLLKLHLEEEKKKKKKKAGLEVTHQTEVEPFDTL